MLYEKKENTLSIAQEKIPFRVFFLFDYFFKPSFLTSEAYRFGDFFSRYFM